MLLRSRGAHDLKEKPMQVYSESSVEEEYDKMLAWSEELGAPGIWGPFWKIIESSKWDRIRTDFMGSWWDRSVQSTESRLFLRKKYELLIGSMRSNYNVRKSSASETQGGGGGESEERFSPGNEAAYVLLRVSSKPWLIRFTEENIWPKCLVSSSTRQAMSSSLAKERCAGDSVKRPCSIQSSNMAAVTSRIAAMLN